MIGLITPGEITRVGDAVGLNISRGPQLYKIPDVAGMKLKDALAKLEEMGFDPWTSFNIRDAWGLAVATGTDPAAGAKLPKGATIQVLYELSVRG